MSKVLTERYRCAEPFGETPFGGPLAAESGYFGFGRDVVGYGRTCSATPAASAAGPLPDLLDRVRSDETGLHLPFDLAEVIDNLTHERYLASPGKTTPPSGPSPLLRKLYYSGRPLLTPALRVALQRIYFRGWEKIPFPAWPLDASVDRLLETVFLLAMKSRGIDRVPFIWFWPEGAPSAAILTHDVETGEGRDFCGRLMDLDESFGFHSAFEIVPEERYTVEPGFLQEIRDRGHEINVQDLNHDGNLYRDREQFLSRIAAVNEYGRAWGAKGFRSAILYRNLEWYSELKFDYDMSVPNVGHLEPQRGGCCTVFPYFIGCVLELPLTTTQDYSLFQILRDYKIELWKAQAARVMERHGLLSFIVHPDYLLNPRAQSVYQSLLEYLAELEIERKMWIALPNQVNEWWRQRSKLYLVPEGAGWRIEGPGKERARLAYATSDGARLVYSLPGDR